jgi:hypothetical protein
VDIDTLIDAASFLPESVQPPSAWIGHLPLAAWVIRRVAPTIFVELGTHTGNSYFSFCQSVAESGLATKCYAVDTWQGDEHAGQYDETIFEAVNAHNERYAGFSHLLRMTFDDALKLFTDQSIELLHIDGLHTYEAVRHDFEGWLPKLAPGAVVMFHDTGVRERDFGVWRLWEELKAEYPNNIELSHSHGLGILQLNSALDGRRQEWLKLDVSKKERLKTYFAALGSLQLERFELNSEWSTSKKDVDVRDVLIADLRQHASNLGQEVSTRDAVIADLRQHASNLGVVIADLRQHASNLGQEVSARDVVIADLRQHASNLEQEVSARNARVASLGQVAAQRDVLIADLTRDVNALRQSTSWRITVPLRWVAGRVKGARHGT